MFGKISKTYILGAICLTAACGGKNNNENGNSSGIEYHGNNGPGGDQDMQIHATANFTGALNLLVLDEQNGSNLVEQHNKKVKELNLNAPLFEKGLSLSLSEATRKLSNGKIFQFGSSPLRFTEGGVGSLVRTQKMNKDTGLVEDAITQQDIIQEQLPLIQTIAISPIGEVFIHFQRPFIYKPAKGSDNPWDMAKGFQCQIFKVTGGKLSDLLTNAPLKDNFECVDNLHFIDQWRANANGVFQFDADGNLFYPGSIPNSGKMVVYKKAYDSSLLTEVINANICVNNFLITALGGTFYTGQTCQNGNNGGGGGGFFRYIAPGTDGQITEIARDWWNFIYDAAITEDKTDKAVFFGPDPRSSSTASWDSACLFEFDPTKEDAQSRISEKITCGSNIWDWMELRRSVDVKDYGEGWNNYTGKEKNFSPSLAWRKEYKRRCETQDEVFAGGGSQISSIKQTSTGDVYVIGNIRKKVGGSLLCSVEFRGPHCTIDSTPILTDANGTAYTATTCAAAAGTWVNKGNCSNGTSDASCIEHARTWTPGQCSTGSYRTSSTCVAGGGTWSTSDSWAGKCNSTDSNDNASAYDNQKQNCIPEWRTDTVWYDNVQGDLCITQETGSRSSWWDWDHKNNNFAQTSSDTRSAYADLTGKFLVNRFNCQAPSTGGSNGGWTEEYSSLAIVNPTKKNLKLLSLKSEKAINLWLVGDKPYYSSFDTTLGKYLLSGLSTENRCIITSKDTSSCSGSGLSWQDRQCVTSSYTTEDTCKAAGYSWTTNHPSVIMSDFEAYNVTESDADGHLFADGLDFSVNQYKFGKVDLEKKEINLIQGFTGTLKTIVVLPKY